jgi:hypothetical protein
MLKKSSSHVPEEEAEPEEAEEEPHETLKTDSKLLK